MTETPKPVQNTTARLDIVGRLDRELRVVKWNKDADGRLPIWPEWIQEARDEIMRLRDEAGAKHQ